MTKVFNTLFSLSILAVSLTACGNQTLPVNQLNRQGVQSLRTNQPATAPVRSNAVLDAVAKRMRFVSFQSTDRDRNGQLTAQEFPLTMPGMNFSSFDKNKDGQLSFAEYDAAMQASKPYGTNRETLRTYAQQMWQQINKDNNSVLLRAEIEEYFTAPYNQPLMPVAPPSSYPGGEPTPIASAVPGYSDPYGTTPGYPTQPNYEQMKYEARKQAIDFFVQADVNLDQKLSPSEYEDGYAKQMLSSSENSLSGNYPYYYPGPGYGYGSGYGTGYGSGSGVYPTATPVRR